MLQFWKIPAILRRLDALERMAHPPVMIPLGEFEARISELEAKVFKKHTAPTTNPNSQVEVLENSMRRILALPSGFGMALTTDLERQLAHSIEQAHIEARKALSRGGSHG